MPSPLTSLFLHTTSSVNTLSPPFSAANFPTPSTFFVLKTPITTSYYFARSPKSSSLEVKMSSSDSLPPLPENRIGIGAVGVDYLTEVAAYPKPDDNIRTTSFKVQGGGNCGNALTCAACLGLNARLISKVADDSQGKGILEELEADGVDTSFLVFCFEVSKEGNSPFTYIIVDYQTKTRTCIRTPGYPPMIPDDLSQSSLLSALDGVKVVYLDGRLPETALLVAEQAWTEASSIPTALISILLRLPKLKFVIVTLGEDGCIMVKRSTDGTVSGRLHMGTAEKIPPEKIIDTTGAGDAFVGAVLYAICANMPPEKMLPFAARVAAAGCRALGARAGLPCCTDPQLAPFLH